MASIIASRVHRDFGGQRANLDALIIVENAHQVRHVLLAKLDTGEAIVKIVVLRANSIYAISRLGVHLDVLMDTFKLSREMLTTVQSALRRVVHV